MKKLVKRFFCVVNGWDCPYWEEERSFCTMVDNGDNPVKECEDAGYFFDDEEDYPFVWEDEDGKLYEVSELLELGYHIINDEPVLPPLLAE